MAVLEIPSANGHATAPALARLMAILARGGRLDGAGGAVAGGHWPQAARERIYGPDLVLPFTWPGRRASCATRASASTARANWRSATPAGAAAAPSPTRSAGLGGLCDEPAVRRT